MEKEILEIMNNFYKKRKQEIAERFMRKRQEKYLNKYYVQEALKNKFSKVYMVSTLKLKLDHYGELKGE